MTVADFNTTSPVLSVDALYPVGATQADIGYVGLVGRYADAGNSLFVKAQNTGRLGNLNVFDTLFIYYGTNAGGWEGMTGGEDRVEIAPFSSGRMTLAVVGSDVIVSIDTNFDTLPDLTYTRGGLPLANLGTQVGMSMLSLDVAMGADNFTADVPEPGTLALSAAAVGTMVLRRRRSPVAKYTL